MALTQSSEEGLKISNAGTNGQYLQKQSGNTGGLTWADVPAGVGGSTGVDFNDNVKARFGTGNDLEIYHNGSTSYIVDNGTGDLILRASDQLKIQETDNGETMAIFNKDGAVELYYDNTKHFETNSTGAKVSGRLEVTDNSYFTGASYNAQWIKAQNRLEFNDNAQATFGTGQDLSIVHSGSHATITNTTGNLNLTNTGSNTIINADNITFQSGDQGETIARFLDEGACELWFNNTKKIETTSTGVDVTGIMQCDEFKLLDGEHAKFGTGEDLRLYHNGSNSYITNSTGNLMITGNNSDKIHIRAHASKQEIVCFPSAQVELYYDDAKKLATSSTGIAVTGQAIATGNSAKWETVESGGATVNIQSGGSTGYVGTTSDDKLQIRTNNEQQVEIYDRNTHFLATNDNSDQPGYAMHFYGCNQNQADMYRISFYEQSSKPGRSDNAHISLRYNGSNSDGGNGSFNISNENGSKLFYVNRAGAVWASSFSKGSGSFQIDHPLESKKNTHFLRHSFIEGPKADNIYRGFVTLSDGTASINLDAVSNMTAGTFVLLNTNLQCFTSNESDWTPVKGSVSGNTLTITAQDNSSTATISWMVIGERQDAHVKDPATEMFDDNGKLIVEPLKPS